MAVRDNPDDLWAVIQVMRQEISQLQRANGLGSSEISSGSLKVATPEGIYVKPGASIDSGDVKIGNASGVGSVKAGPDAEFSKDGIGIGGTKIGPDGKIGNAAGEVKFGNSIMGDGSLRTKQNVNADGFIIAEGYIQGRTGVYTPWEGGTATVESIAGGIKTTATNAASAASAAQSTADSAASAASAAQSTANSASSAASAAQSTANTANTKAEFAQGEVDDAQSKIGQIMSVYNAHVDSYHPGAPKMGT